jgi:hypothetical protein
MPSSTQDPPALEALAQAIRRVQSAASDSQLTRMLTRHLEIAEPTRNRWQNQYGGMKATEARRRVAEWTGQRGEKLADLLIGTVSSTVSVRLSTTFCRRSRRWLARCADNGVVEADQTRQSSQPVAPTRSGSWPPRSVRYDPPCA